MSPTPIPPGPPAAIQVYGDPQLHTDGEILALAFAADGTLVSVEEPGMVRHWHATMGRQLAWHHLSDLEMLWAFSLGARALASSGRDLLLWDPATGRLLATLPQPAWVSAVAYHPGGRLVATGHDDGAVRYWDVAARRLRYERRLHHQPISALAFSADGACLAAAAEDRTIGLLDAAHGQVLASLAGHTDRIPALAFHPAGRHLVSAGWDGTARVWDVRTGQAAGVLTGHADQVVGLAFSPDGRLLACGDAARSIHVWHFAGRKILHVLSETEAEQLAFSADGQRLAAGGSSRVIRIWDPLCGTAFTGAAAPASTRMSIALSPDGGRLAAGGGAVRLWDTALRQILPPLDGNEVIHALAYSPDGRLIAGGAAKYIPLWDAASGRTCALLEGPEEPVTTLAFAPDGQTLAAASARGLDVWLWRVANGEPLLLIPDALQGCGIETLAFHPGGRLLAVGGIDWLATGGSSGAVGLWDVAARCEVATFPSGTTGVAFDPAGQRLASTAVDHAICVWDLNTEQLVLELLGHEDAVNSIVYSPHGRWLASGSDDRTVRLWDAATGAALAVQQLDSQVKALCVQRDGSFLFTGNGNTTCYELEVANLLRG
jgi:WD40 repeat protein